MRMERARKGALHCFIEVAMSDEKKAWDAGADIPKEPTERLIIAGSGGRMWESEPMPMGTFDSLRAAAESSLHPTGRCTCGGEGRCAWCDEICPTCLGSCVGDEPWLVCEFCGGTGYADGMYLTAEQRAAKVADIRADVADYEALGYLETETGEVFELDHAAWLVRFVSDGIQQSARPLRAIQKDIRSDRDNG